MVISRNQLSSMWLSGGKFCGGEFDEVVCSEGSEWGSELTVNQITLTLSINPKKNFTEEQKAKNYHMWKFLEWTIHPLPLLPNDLKQQLWSHDEWRSQQMCAHTLSQNS